MSKKIKFQTRSLGSEPDPRLNKEELAGWIQSRTGRAGDLTRFRLLQPLIYQREAGVDVPGIGGLFYRDRLLECLSGIDKGKITGELGLDAGLFKTDIEEAVKKPNPLWISMPGPAQLGITDEYYGDPEEVSRNLLFWYRRLMREMRDSGADGHILICDHVHEMEIEELCGRKTFFFLRDPDLAGLELLLEHQRSLAVSYEALDLVLGLKEEYPVDKLVLINPTHIGLKELLKHWESDKIEAGGYCTGNCPEYWKNIVHAAEFQAGSE